MTPRHHHRRAFTLLEVILALAVLAVALAIIGEANNSADQNARRAALESDATLVAESVIAELTAGTRDLAPVSAAPWDDGDGIVRWTIDIALQPAVQEGLLTVGVAVQEAQPIGRTPVRVEITRWFVDPASLPAETNSGDDQ